MTHEQNKEFVKKLVRAACTYATVYEMEQKTSFGGAFTALRQEKEDELHILCREFFQKITEQDFLSAPPLFGDGASTRPEEQKVSG